MIEVLPDTYVRANIIGAIRICPNDARTVEVGHADFNGSVSYRFNTPKDARKWVKTVVEEVMGA